MYAFVLLQSLAANIAFKGECVLTFQLRTFLPILKCAAWLILFDKYDSGDLPQRE